jgi:hypothetical protein
MKLEAHLYRWQHTRKTRIAPSTNVQSRDNPSVMMMKLKDSTQMMQPILLKQNQARKISSIPRLPRCLSRERTNTSSMSESAEEWKSTMSGMKTDRGVGKKPNCNEVGNKTDCNVGMKTDCKVGNKSTASGTKML